MIAPRWYLMMYTLIGSMQIFHLLNGLNFIHTLMKISLQTRRPPRGNPIKLNVFVDASHASNKINRRSHTGILIYSNRSPII